MTNIYYTANEGRRNNYGHTTTRGTVYIIRRGNNTTPHGEDALEDIGDYVHQSGGAEITASLLSVVEKAGIDTNGGYYSHWREAVNLISL
jgi:hypothetical protein